MELLQQSIFAVISYLLIAMLMWSLWRTLSEGIHHLKKLHSIPCSRCVYFTGDYRLKCTVRPCDALTEEAIGCRDFSATQYALAPKPDSANVK